MRKILVLVALLVAAVSLAAPTFAQDRPTIPEWLTNDADGRFTTLLAAVEAAGLGETLSGDGPFTLFAPTNDAFAAAFEALGVTPEDALADPDLLTSILLFHVVPDQYFFRNLTSGPVLETALEGETVKLNLSRGILTVNNAVVSDVDGVASNGVVQVIDSVILPMAAAQAFPAYVRVGHLSPDAGNVDVWVNFQPALTDVSYLTISDWMLLPAGVYNIAVSPTGGEFGDAVIGPVDVTLGNGSFTTVAAIGSATAEEPTLTAAVLASDYSTVTSDTAQVTLFHAIEGAGPVSVTANGTAIVTNLAYPGTFEEADGTPNDGMYTVSNITPGEYDLAIVAADGTTILEAPATNLQAGYNYFIAATGTTEQPSLSVVITDVAGMQAEMAAQ